MKKKKWLMIIVALIVIIFVTVGLNFALRSEFTYSVNTAGTITITGYRGNDVDVVIPEEIEGRTVKVLGMGCFIANEEMVSVDIPESVTMIEDFAFYSCTNLTIVTGGEGIKEIQDQVFDKCNKLENITLFEGLEHIGEFAFSSTSITKITIPSTVERIRQGAFFETDLKEIYIPRAMTVIPENMFGNHGEITVYIPSSVERIGCTSALNGTDISYNNMDKITLVVEEGSYAEEYAKQKAEETGMKYRVVERIEYN